ncbi:hypothetical protein B0A49_03690 [Cryomyces minteri]|uniref:Major facilitator superfamily (MFS) profile domain-containing protein n=1 Tax=Cryomyces minteri TaxID=331657 RepID=A0A4U0XUU2_9PEZI|nr:hypothetical protein B0A49_03690 [Cryomyces minteri]
MAGLQVLSTAANAFAVVGLADVVFRVSTELYDLFDRCKAAPRTISQLLSELKSLASIVATVRVFADEFQASPYALEDQQVLLPQLETILGDIERDFGELKTLAITSQSNTNDAWFKQWGKNSSWSLNEQKALRACQQLERHKTALIAALSVTGRRNDIVIRNKLKATRTDITDAYAAAETKFQDVQQHITSSSTTTQQGLQQVFTSVQRSSHSNEAGFTQVQASIASSQTTISAMATAVRDQTAIAKDCFDSSELASQARHSIVEDGLSQIQTLANQNARSVNKQNSNLEILKILIDKGADVHVVEPFGTNVLHRLLTPFALRPENYKAYGHRDALVRARDVYEQNNTANERQPLLGSRQRSPSPNDEAAEQSGDGEEESTPIVEEPSTKMQVLTLGNSTIVATLSAPISTSFDSFTLFSWLASSYLIANAALQPLSGRLTDIFGRRAGLVASNIFFAAGNLICGLAKDEWVIILGRVVAGCGGGGLNAIASFVASDLVPLRKRGLWQGFGNICFGLGSGLGGVFGGFVNDRIGWRWAFLIQVPFVVVSGILVFFTVDIPVKVTDKSRIRRVDFLGAFTLTAALVLLLLGLNSGGNIVPWTHPLVLTTLPLSAVALAIFIYVEDRVASEPIIPVRLLLDRTVASACLTNWFTSMAVFGLLYYGPVYFQVRGLSATAAGVRLIPQSLGASVGSLGSGLIMRATGRYYLLNVGIETALVAAFALVAATFNLTTPAWPPFIYFFLGGVGYGGILTVTLLALISAVEHRHQAVITSASYAFRSTGSTIGITVASAVFQNILKAELWSRFGDQPEASHVIGRIRDSIDEVKHLPPGWRDGVLETYMDALRGVWLTLFGLALLGGLVSLAMREHVLHNNLARK